MSGYISESVDGPRVTRKAWLGIKHEEQPGSVEVKGGSVSVQVGGTFGSVSVLIEGSNDGRQYGALTDPQGNPLIFMGPDIKQISEQVSHIRPVLDGGGGADTSVDVILLVRSVI